MKTNFIVMTAAAKMPSSCKGHYRKVAVCEVEVGKQPAMISERARGMVRIVELWDRLNVGGPKSAYQLALVDAQRMAIELNGRAP
jgi:hypothetical protein